MKKLLFTTCLLLVAAGAAAQSATEQAIATASLGSDVDRNIPQGETTREKTFAVIIANENYEREERVPFALNDGEVFRQYLIQTLGVPEKNIHFRADATLNHIRGEVHWLEQVALAHGEEAQVIFYYAGHGVPDEQEGTAYLLPKDGYASNPRTGYRLNTLYWTLSELPAESVLVFLDACFSGAERGGGMLASARGVAIRAKEETPRGNMVVFSAAQGDQTAYPYAEQGHGLFTYYLLKKLQETTGDVTLGELGDYLTTQVRQRSIVENSKSQIPSVAASAKLPDWEEQKL